MHWDRRDFWQVAAGMGVVAATARGAAALSETEPNVTTQPTAAPSDNATTADILVETLIEWGATHVFGIVGDGINPIIEALRRQRDRIAYIGVRHEEAAAFMAGGFAKHTGRLGVCVGTTGPGAIHLMNGLYDASLDGAPVVALTGLTFHDLRGVRYQQGIDTLKLMEPLAVYNEEVTGPEHALIIANRACRAALGDRGVAHLAISKDVQMMKLSADKRSMRNPGARTSSSWSPSTIGPSAGSASRCRGGIERGIARRDLSRPGRFIRARRGDATRRCSRRASGEGFARQSGPSRRQSVHDRRHRRSRHRAVVLGHGELRHCPDPRVDHAVGRILSAAGTGARRAGRSQARSPGLAVSG